MASRYSLVDVNNVIAEIQGMAKVRDSIPTRFDKAYDLIQEMNNEMYVKCDQVSTMLKDIVCNGAAEDTPF